MKKNLRVLIVILIILVGNISICAAPPLAAIQKAKNLVENARYQLPVEAGYGLVLTQVSYDSKTYTLVYRYHYTIPVAKPTTQAIYESKQGIIHLLKANPNSEDMQILKSGISFHYNYYDMDGNFLWAVKITPADVK